MLWYFGIMDPISSIHNSEEKPCSDVSHFEEIFHTTLEEGVLIEHRLANLELSSNQDDYIKNLVKVTYIPVYKLKEEFNLLDFFV